MYVGEEDKLNDKTSSSLELRGGWLINELGLYSFIVRASLAALFFRAAAEYCNHGDSQNYLAVLYNAGAGVEKDDLVSLYWFDRVVDNGCEAAKQDRIGIFHAYKDNNSSAGFYDIMMTLSGRCARGDGDIPKDAEKAAYWRAIGEGKAIKL